MSVCVLNPPLLYDTYLLNPLTHSEGAMVQTIDGMVEEQRLITYIFILNVFFFVVQVSGDPTLTLILSYSHTHSHTLTLSYVLPSTR
jgi:hypothetical protein